MIGKTFLISLWSFFHEAQRTLFSVITFSQIHIHKITDLTHLGTLKTNMNLLELMLKPFHATQILTMQKQLKFCSTMGVYENLDLSSIKVVRFLSDPFTRTIIVLGN
jgi:hypothetical protein